MKLLIDCNGNVGFDEWFWEEDAEKIVQALKVIRTDIEIERVDYEFKDEPILAKKKIYDPIPMTARNIAIILSNSEKTNSEILKLLGIERESDFVITTRFRWLEGEFQKWEKMDNTKQWQSRQESVKAFADYFSQELKDKKRGE